MFFVRTPLSRHTIREEGKTFPFSQSDKSDTNSAVTMADNQNTEDLMKHCYENLIVIDVGANLTNKKYSRDLDSVMQRAKDAGN